MVLPHGQGSVPMNEIETSQDRATGSPAEAEVVPPSESPAESPDQEESPPPRPDLRSALEASWAHNEAGYRYLAR